MKKEEVCALIRKVAVIPAVQGFVGRRCALRGRSRDPRRHTDCRNHHDRAGAVELISHLCRFQSKARSRGRDGS